ncbi:putative multidrug resistance abc [Diaporthe ampelina]|uniref:Putative multidrug resistance abc n=1 Tax=Diaporthe ampelina TaxID=1214573 RepID=A0A0G2F812_9PEZI|nr:putative multidrug resistance abc [Diaporthe ampelina]
MFDRLLLLNNSGKTLYFGDLGQDASILVDYLESKGAPECRQGENPAEWMFEVTRSMEPSVAQSEPKTEEWSEKWQQSQQRQSVLRELSDFLAKTPTPQKTAATPAPKPHAYAASPLQQFLIVSQRTLQDQWRDPVYLYTKIALCTILSLLNGISFYYIPLNIQGLTSLLFSIFLISQLFSTVDQLIIPRLTDGRAVFEARERHSHSYSWPVFIASDVLIESLWQTVISVPVFVSWYYPTGLQRNGDVSFSTAERGGLTFMFIWLFNLWSSTLSQLFAVGISQAEVAVQMATLCFWLALVFCG